jgi:two-component system, NtrC family, sensor kinase
LNLLSNAIHAMNERPLADNRITLRGYAVDGDHVSIELEDNGAGMTPEVQARAFEPFFTTKPVGVGMGLGLYVCRNLIAAMNGSLTITSQLGCGTRATVQLARAAAKATSVRPPDALPLPREERRVLIVDDEPLVIRTLGRMLGGRFGVTAVASVDEALSVLQGARFDAILCDVMMPGRGGADLLEELSVRDAAMAARVGFITAGPFDPRSQTLLESVGDRWVSKPFDAAAVERLLDRLVGA